MTDTNTGDRNTGNLNTGNLNTGDRNTGNLNTGNRNTGSRNTGSRNTGYRNTGSRNTGNLNTGNRNTGSRNTGYLNTITPTTGYIFNKLVDIFDANGNCILDIPSWFYFDFISSNGRNNPCLWIPISDMSEQERKENINSETVGGYIKLGLVSKDMKTHWRTAFDKCNNLEDIKKTLSLPNFDYDIFAEITGITKSDFDTKLGVTMVGKKAKVIIDGKEYNVTIDS